MLARLPLLAVVLASCASAPPEGARSVIVAERRNWCGPNWKASFTPDQVLQRIQNNCMSAHTDTRRFRPTESQWAAVSAALSSSQFAELPPEITTVTNADGTITLRTDDPVSCIEASGHRVCGTTYALEHTPEGERFRRVWSALCAIAPEPEL